MTTAWNGSCYAWMRPRTLRQRVFDRGQEVETGTLNKGIPSLNEFLDWAAGSRFVSAGLGLQKIEVA
jgi:hypothetical protein